jgi:hypothetical protein
MLVCGAVNNFKHSIRLKSILRIESVLSRNLGVFFEQKVRFEGTAHSLTHPHHTLFTLLFTFTLSLTTPHESSNVSLWPPLSVPLTDCVMSEWWSDEVNEHVLGMFGTHCIVQRDAASYSSLVHHSEWGVMSEEEDVTGWASSPLTVEWLSSVSGVLFPGCYGYKTRKRFAVASTKVAFRV